MRPLRARLRAWTPRELSGGSTGSIAKRCSGFSGQVRTGGHMPDESQKSQIMILEFHPPEDLRRFACRPGSIIRADDAMVVIESAHEGILLRHNMWADHWFTITTTTDMAGHFVETG